MWDTDLSAQCKQSRPSSAGSGFGLALYVNNLNIHVLHWKRLKVKLWGEIYDFYIQTHIHDSILGLCVKMPLVNL